MSLTRDKPSFLMSNKGKPLLVLNGIVYKKNKETKTKKYWVCQTNGCSGYVHTNLQNVVLKVTGNHNHLPHPENMELKNFRTKVKERVMKETTPIIKIYEEEVISSELPPQTLAIMPLARELQSGLTYVRRKMTPPLPDSCMFEIPDSYQMTFNNEQYLARDMIVRRRKRMLIFSTKTQLEVLFDSALIMMDGTFSATPPFFHQIYSIHALKYDSSFPCVFTIMPNNKKPTYLQLFNELKSLAAELNRSFQPSRIFTDFEPSILSLIPTEFPSSIHSGCFFHMTQAVYRRVQNLGLSTIYVNDIDIRTSVRKLMALALLPVDKVQIAFDNLRTNSSENVKETLHQLFLYFDNYWMQEIPLLCWNVHGLQHRTNNICEGFHNRLNHRIEKSHSNIWSFIKTLQGEESRFRHMLIQMNAGAKGRPKTAATNAIQQRIDTLNERYSNNEIDLQLYLDGLSTVVARQYK